MRDINFKTIQLGKRDYKCYYTLNDLKDNNDMTDESFITSFQYNEDGKRYFILFDKYIDFVHLIYRILPTDFHFLLTEDMASFDDFFDQYPNFRSTHQNVHLSLNFNEVITNDSPFRMFYDIDCENVNVDKDVLLSETIDAILKYLKTEEDIEYPINRIVVINGHKNTKISYHLIFPDVVVENMETMRIIAENIKTSLGEYGEYIDCSYMNTKNFRMIFNTKRGSKNFLKFQKKWTYISQNEDEEEVIEFNFMDSNKKLEFTLLFEYSRIQSFLGINSIIQSKTKEEKNIIIPKITNEEIENTINDIEFPKGLKIGKNIRNIVHLTNNGGFDCPICQRRHENDNAYIIIRENGVFFKCYRTPNDRVKIKDIKPQVIPFPKEVLDNILEPVGMINNDISSMVDQKDIRDPPENEIECAEWYLSFNVKNDIKIIYWMDSKIVGYRWNESKLLWVNDLCNSKLNEHIKQILLPEIKKNLDKSKERYIKNKSNISYEQSYKSWMRFNNIFSKTNYLNCVKSHCKSDLFDDTFISKLDISPSILPIRDGIIDLKTGIFRKRTKEDYCIKECPVTWVEDIDYSEVEKIIGQIIVDKEVYEFIQSFFGYCITGENDEKIFFIAIGSGNNGKSLFFSQFEHLLGDKIFYTACSKEVFLNSKYDKQTSPELFQLKGMRLSLCHESDEQKELKESTIKAITGNDPISGRELYKPMESVKLSCKLGLITNHLPVIKSNSEAIWNRIVPIDFNSSFKLEHKDLDEKTQYQERKFPLDSNLGKRIATEEYKSKFLRWLVEGSKKYYSQRLKIPDSVKLSKKNYQNDSDILQDFIDECIERCPGTNIQIGFRDVYVAFSKYCRDVKRLSSIPISDKKFKSRMEEKNILSIRNNGTQFKDIKISEI